jgi:cytochrome c oxidase assembly protein subunit 15
MAVPDWPNTYGYNLFLYPWQTWLFGPWDLFIEHGHRLLGSLVGMLAIALVIATWRCEARRWVRWMSLAVLAAVIAQGVLGGMRVVANDVQLAKIHGCFGPAFFALTGVMATVTSRRWREATPQRDSKAAKLQRLAMMTALFAYLQLMLGAELRHQPIHAAQSTFRIVLYFHLIMAGVVAVHAVLLAVRATRFYRHEKWIYYPSVRVSLLVGLQLLLGASTWITKYGTPAWLSQYDWAAGFTVSANGPLQAIAATMHVAIGSMILMLSVLVSVRSLRLLQAPARSVAIMPRAMEVMS